MKICCICLQELPLTEFYKSGLIKDGYRTNCRTCYLEESKSYQRTLKGKASRKAANRRYYEKRKAANKNSNVDERNITLPLDYYEDLIIEDPSLDIDTECAIIEEEDIENEDNSVIDEPSRLINFEDALRYIHEKDIHHIERY